MCRWPQRRTKSSIGLNHFAHTDIYLWENLQKLFDCILLEKACHRNWTFLLTDIIIIQQPWQPLALVLARKNFSKPALTGRCFWWNGTRLYMYSNLSRYHSLIVEHSVSKRTLFPSHIYHCSCGSSKAARSLKHELNKSLEKTHLHSCLLIYKRTDQVKLLIHRFVSTFSASFSCTYHHECLLPFDDSSQHHRWWSSISGSIILFYGYCSL